MVRASDKTKRKRKYGTGRGKEYIPFIHTRESNSLGTTAVFNDWITGRQVHCLSQAEMKWYHILRFDEKNVDILEQYPLNMDFLAAVAHDLGYYVNPEESRNWTTDFLVEREDGSFWAYCVKYDDNVSEKECIRLGIKKEYWKRLNCGFRILLGRDVNDILFHNIMLVVEFYDRSKVYDRYSMFKHLVARKEIKIDLTKKLLSNDVIDVFLEAIDYERLEA